MVRKKLRQYHTTLVVPLILILVNDEETCIILLLLHGHTLGKKRTGFHITLTSLTCSRCFWYPFQRSDLSHLESRFNFVTAVTSHTVSLYRQRHYQNNPPKVNACEQSQRHCSISSAISLRCNFCRYHKRGK